MSNDDDVTEAQQMLQRSPEMKVSMRKIDKVMHGEQDCEATLSMKDREYLVPYFVKVVK